MRVEERRLHGVLRLVARAELVHAEAEDLRRVALVEILRRVRVGALALDSCCAAYGGDCGDENLTWRLTRLPLPGR